MPHTRSRMDICCVSVEPCPTGPGFLRMCTATCGSTGQKSQALQDFRGSRPAEAASQQAHPVGAPCLPGGVALVAPTAGAGTGATLRSSTQGHRHAFHLTVITVLNLIILSK